MSHQHALMMLAENAEHVASELRPFRDSLPRYATQITAIIRESFAISTALREISGAYSSPRYQPSFWRIHDGMGLVIRSLQFTYDGVFLMFRRAADRRHHQLVWEDLRHQMERGEGLGLLERLQLYTTFLEAQRDVVKGLRAAVIHGVERQLRDLLEAQEAGSGLRTPRALSDPEPRISRSRPRQVRPPSQIISPPLSPSGFFDDETMPYSPRSPPMAPEVPLPSPGFSSGSSRPLTSTQTSYGNDAYATTARQMIHWAQNVFRGNIPATPFFHDYQLDGNSTCHGQIEPDALHEMSQDSFRPAIALPFDRELLWLQLYWRPEDNRARIFVQTKDRAGHDLYYCSTLQSLKIIRQRSCLRLCKLSRVSNTYLEWARLNFRSYERMVLFYCTFVAMKYQDEREIQVVGLDDFCELSQPLDGEEQLYGGETKHGDLRHHLRLFRDRGSGAVRLEASACRGPMQDVPLWTAFVTKWTNDSSWAYPEQGSIVSLAVIRPPPYVFLAGYTPPMDSQGQYILHFNTRGDASHFIEVWIRLCNSSRA